ncbi:DUF262 domain-containing protein [Nonlabens sp. Asnod3-H03]|uniref:DUF262 domain-containing protein n=1 Tax=Nonlabens sp. Asnod3-H03 TaxID=3160580 RepID=UPI003867249A
MTKTFIPTKKTIGELYYKPNFIYTIPKYQRPYSWRKENLEELWKVIERGESIFLGTVIYNIDEFETKQEKEIIDGQQRYVTITILAAALRNFLLEFHKNSQTADSLSRANDVNENLIGQRQVLTNEFKNYLKVGSTAQSYFENNIQLYNSSSFLANSEEEIGLTDPKTEEEKLIKIAYLYFKERIKEKVVNSDYESVFKMIYKNLNQLFVISIEIDDYEMAFEIFESVNGQGVDLSVSDLIKNQIFKNIDKNLLLKAEETWIDIIENLESSGIEISPKEFLRYYWASKHNYIPDSKLYNAIKNELKSEKEKWHFLLEDLHEESQILNKILTYTKGQWQNELGLQNGMKVHYCIRALKAIRGKTWIVLVVALFRNQEKLKTYKLNFIKHLEKIQEFTFYYSGIMGLPGNWYWIQIHTTARKINQYDDKSKLNELFLNLFKTFGEKLNPSKHDFYEGISGIKYSNKNRSLIRYTLSEIESKLQGKESSGWNEDKVNIEHYVPQEPKEWNLNKKEIKPYIHSLGNLLLIPERLNGRLQNKPSSEKINIIKKVEPDMMLLKILVENIENRKWDFDSLKNNNFLALTQRQEYMSEIAYEIWVVDLKRKLGY